MEEVSEEDKVAEEEEVSEEDKVAEEEEIATGVIDHQEKVSRMKDASYVVSSHIGSEIVRNTGWYKYQNIAPHSKKHQTTALHTVTPGEVSMTTTEAGGLREVKEEQDFQTWIKCHWQPGIIHTNEEAHKGILKSSYIEPYLSPQEGEVECYYKKLWVAYCI